MARFWDDDDEEMLTVELLRPPAQVAPTGPVAVATPPAGIQDRAAQATGSPVDTIGDPAVSRPGVATRTSTFPIEIGRASADSNTPAETGILPVPFLVPAPGVIRVAGALTASGTPAIPTISWDRGRTWIQLNGGTALAGGVWWDETVTAVPGLPVLFSVSTETTWASWWALFIPSA